MNLRSVAILAVLVVFGRSSVAEPPRSGMVVSTSSYASRAGLEVLKKGGNAVDAAVATAFALAVTWPSAGNLGGGGFMLILPAGDAGEIIDYRETAPAAATRAMYLDSRGEVIENASTVGAKAVAVPGTVAGLAMAHERHGKLPWKDVVAPAVRLAREGFEVDAHLAEDLADAESVKVLSRFRESRRLFLRSGKGWKSGETFRQPELASTLERIMTVGAREFYEGKTARLLLDEIRRGRGIVSAADLRAYRPVVREPLRGTYRGYDIVTMPPPSSGGIVLLEMLNALERRDPESGGRKAPERLHLMIEVMRRAYADRSRFMGDPQFVKVPVAGLTSKEYAAKLAASIDPERATPSAEVSGGEPFAYEPDDTTHFVVVDAAGAIVTNTYTLNDSYGCGLVVRGAGFLLNNEMDDFTSKVGVPNVYGLVQGEANAIAPGKRPLSSMVPTIVVRDGRPVLALGSPGGPRIITSVMQVILNIVDFGMGAQEAVDAARIHHQWLPDEVYWERDRLPADLRRSLEAKGHRFREKPIVIGEVQAIAIAPDGTLTAGSDARGGKGVAAE